MIKINSNLTEVLAKLDRLARAGADLTPLMRILSGVLHDQVEENFAQQGRPRWTNLAPATVAKRAKEGTWPGKILQRRGRLAASVTPGSSASSAWVATNLAYARIHQFGGTIERAAYGGTVRLATDRRGNLIRQGKGGKLAVFAKDRRKNARAVRFETGPYQVRIPPRAYFLVPREGEERILGAAERYIAAFAK
jgi:phage virion morphogenesis protein